jgi:putative transposase
MARQSRVEFAGATYHVINRGNYRSGIFEQGRSGEVFDELLLESCDRFGWKLHAYCIMSNHYHLALETPEANLSVGMQWLQSVFGNRFNRYVKTPGHVFQGRYKSPLIEPGPSLLRVVNYIHLNPVAAGIIPLGKLDAYPLSSFPKFLRRDRTASLRWDWLEEAGFDPGVSGMRKYWRYLESIREKDPKKLAEIERSLCLGWFIGSKEEKQALLKGLRDEGNLQEADLARLDAQEHAKVLLEAGLKVVGQTGEGLKSLPKSCFLKASLCRLIHKNAGVSNLWLAEHLSLGHPQAVSRIRRRLPQTRDERKLEKQVQAVAGPGKEG